MNHLPWYQLVWDIKPKGKPRWLMLLGGVASILDGLSTLLTLGQLDGTLRCLVADYALRRAMNRRNAERSASPLNNKRKLHTS